MNRAEIVRANAASAYEKGKQALAQLPWSSVAFIGGTSFAYTLIGEAADSTVGPGWQAVAGMSTGAALGYVARQRDWHPIVRSIGDGIFVGGCIAGLRTVYDWWRAPTNTGDPRAVYSYMFCAPEQRRTDLDPPPAWLSVDTEVCGGMTHFPSREAFAATIFERLLSLGLPAKLAFEVAAHFAMETGYGSSFGGNNLGGWKVTQSWANAFQQRYGRPAAWWRAEGHIEGGDRPTTYYRAYPSIDAFLLDWIDQFIPRPGTVDPSSKYARCGQLAWSGGDWFAELLHQGYRGSVTQADPSSAIASQNTLVQRMRDMYAQYKLGRTPASLTLDDADRAALLQAQAALGVQQTGVVDDATAVAMAMRTGVTRASGAVIRHLPAPSYERECVGYNHGVAMAA